MAKTINDLVAEVSDRIRILDAAAAQREIEANRGILIDVREPAEVQARAAAGSVAIPRGLLEWKIGEHVSDPDTHIYLHCAAGGRAALAAEALERLGYNAVTAIGCGIDVVCERFGEQ